MPSEPATSRTADRHLWASTGRAGSQDRTAASSTTWAVADDTSRPMSATRTSPASEAPSASNSPGFQAANVTVTSATRGWPAATPVSPSTPEGMSTARTGVAGSAGRGER